MADPLRISAADLKLMHPQDPRGLGRTIWPAAVACMVPGARGRHATMAYEGYGYSLTSVVPGLPDRPPASFPTPDAALEWLADQINRRLASEVPR